MPEIEIYNPNTLGKPLGQYSQIARVRRGELLFIAGQLAFDKAGSCVGEGDFDAQCGQIFRNIEDALKSAGATWSNVTQFTTYMLHAHDIPNFMKFRLREFPKMFANEKYPPNTLLMISRLVDERCLIEVQTIAAI